MAKKIVKTSFSMEDIEKRQQEERVKRCSEMLSSREKRIDALRLIRANGLRAKGLLEREKIEQSNAGAFWGLEPVDERIRKSDLILNHITEAEKALLSLYNPNITSDSQDSLKAVYVDNMKAAKGFSKWTDEMIEDILKCTICDQTDTMLP